MTDAEDASRNEAADSPLEGKPRAAWLRWLDFAPARLAVYYVLVFALFWSLFSSSPALRDAISQERTRHVLAESHGLEFPWSSATTEQQVTLKLPLVAAFSSIFALFVALPISWVYGWTSRKKTYSKAFAQSLLVFPVAVATVVFLVKGSLALAFSLAGIVATVRFRSRLAEVRDAVFLFLAIGIGLAAGVQLILVAFATSVLFSFVMLWVRKVDFGARPQRLSGLWLSRSGTSALKTQAPGEKVSESAPNEPEPANEAPR